MVRKTLKTILISGLSLLPFFALASGTGGLGVNRGLDSIDFSRQTDPYYEQGKAIYRGKVKEYKGIKYCLFAPDQETKTTKIKSKTIKPFKGSKLQEFAKQLRSCDNFEEYTVTLLSRDDMLILLYYLNKRYKLKLA